VKLLADLHIAPRTVAFLRAKGHDVVRAGDVSAIVALSGESSPSIVSLRLESSRIESVNTRFDQALRTLEAELSRGALVTVEEGRIQIRTLPIS
jgi:hypothetical protein